MRTYSVYFSGLWLWFMIAMRSVLDVSSRVNCYSISGIDFSVVYSGRFMLLTTLYSDPVSNTNYVSSCLRKPGIHSFTYVTHYIYVRSIPIVFVDSLEIVRVLQLTWLIHIRFKLMSHYLMYFILPYIYLLIS